MREKAKQAEEFGSSISGTRRIYKADLPRYRELIEHLEKLAYMATAELGENTQA